MSVKAFDVLLTHITQIYAAVLHANLQLGIFLLKKVDLLHDIVEVLLKISWGRFLGLKRLLGLPVFQIKRL